MHYVIEKLVNRSSECYINAPAPQLSRADTLVSFDINDVHWTEVNSTERYGAFLPPLLSLRCTQWPAGQCFLWTESTALYYHLVPAMPLSCRRRDEFAVAEKKGRKYAALYSSFSFVKHSVFVQAGCELRRDFQKRKTLHEVSLTHFYMCIYLFFLPWDDDIKIL